MKFRCLIYFFTIGAIFIGAPLTTKCSDRIVVRVEDADSIVYDDGDVKAEYNKKTGNHHSSLRSSARQTGNYENWHLTDPREHYLSLKRKYELQQNEALESREPEESEDGEFIVDENSSRPVNENENI